LNGLTQELSTHSFAFLKKLTAFDPLPDQVHPYFQIDSLPYLQFDHTPEELVLTGLN